MLPRRGGRGRRAAPGRPCPCLRSSPRAVGAFAPCFRRGNVKGAFCFGVCPARDGAAAVLPAGARPAARLTPVRAGGPTPSSSWPWTRGTPGAFQENGLRGDDQAAGKRTRVQQPPCAVPVSAGAGSARPPALGGAHAAAEADPQAAAAILSGGVGRGLRTGRRVRLRAPPARL